MMKHFTLTLMAAAAMLMPAKAQKIVKNVYTSQERLNIEQLTDQTREVRLIRTLFAGYNTICLPVTLSAEELQAAAKNVQIERLAAIKQEGEVLNLYFLDCTEEGMQAGVPYLIFSPTTQVMHAKVADNVNTTLQSVTMRDKEGNNQITFGSAWESLQVDGRYGIPAQQDAYVLESILIRTEADKTFLPTRCGFTWDKQATTARKLEIMHVTSLNDATSVSKLQAANAIVDVYDLQGKLVSGQTQINSALSSLPQGVYVVNGQKVMVK